MKLKLFLLLLRLRAYVLVLLGPNWKTTLSGILIIAMSVYDFFGREASLASVVGALAGAGLLASADAKPNA